MRTTTRLHFVLMLALVWVQACGGSDADSSTDAGAQQADLPGEDLVVRPQACDDLPDLSGAAFRVTQMMATEPTTELNPIWAQNLAEYQLNLIFLVLEHDRAGRTLKLRVGPATSVVEGVGAELTALEYNYSLEPYDVTVSLDGCRFEIPKEAAVALDIINETVSGSFRVEGIIGNADFSEDGLTMKNGHLSGFIRESLAEDLCMTIPNFGVANFHWFMNLARICPTLDLDEDGDLDAYAFKGTFLATQTDLFQEGIVPVGSLATECSPNREQCFPSPVN